jgi:hypothetical protein
MYVSLFIPITNERPIYAYCHKPTTTQQLNLQLPYSELLPSDPSVHFMDRRLFAAYENTW